MRRGVCFLATLILISFSMPIFADGKFFASQAIKVPPSIPSQKAVIVYKDGTETLIVESALEGKGKEFGWVIPVTGMPTKFKKASPGMIKTLSFNVQPKIVSKREFSSRTEILLIFLPIVAFFTLLALVEKPKNRVFSGILYLIIFLFLAAISMPVMSGKMDAMTPLENSFGVKVKNVQEIGSYELVVVEAEKADGLDEWLSASGFAGLSEKEKQIVEDYIREKWYFVAAKLKRNSDGLSIAHPLSITFPSRQIVYPMRLTAGTGSEIYLELFVIADKKAENEKLKLEVSDGYHHREKAGTLYSSQLIVPDLFMSYNYRIALGHPEVLSFMWEGCVLSRLDGILQPSDMKEDIYITLSNRESFQKRYFSKTAAMANANNICLLGAILFMAGFTVTHKFNYKDQNNGSKAAKQTIVAALIIFPVLWITAYAIPEKVATTESLGIHSIHRFDTLIRKIVSSVIKENNYFKGMEKETITKILEDYLKANDIKNSFIGGKIKNEDSMGNFIVIKKDGNNIVRFFDNNGSPIDLDSSLVDNR